MPVTEIIEMTVKEGVSDEKFIEVLDKLETEFHMKSAGYIDSEVFKGNDGTWFLIMHWESMELLMVSGKEMRVSEKTASFFQTLDMSKLRVQFNEQIKAWSI